MNIAKGGQIMSYVGLDQIGELCRLKQISASGLFFSLHDATASILIVRHDDILHGVFLSADRRFYAFPIDATSSTLGAFYMEPGIEVDPTSRFNASNERAGAGSLVISKDEIGIVAKFGASVLDLGTCALWAAASIVSTDAALGFRRWRICRSGGSMDESLAMIEAEARPNLS